MLTILLKRSHRMTSQWSSGDGSLLDLLTKPGAGTQRGNRKICSCLDFGSKVGDDMEYGIMDGQAHCGDYAIASLRSNNFHLSIKTCYSRSRSPTSTFGSAGQLGKLAVLKVDQK